MNLLVATNTHEFIRALVARYKTHSYIIRAFVATKHLNL